MIRKDVDRIQQKSKEQVQSNADRKVKNHEKSEMKDYRIYTTEAVKIHRTVRVSIDNSISAQRRGQDRNALQTGQGSLKTGLFLALESSSARENRVARNHGANHHTSAQELLCVSYCNINPFASIT
jgi:hypothetical protein